MRQRFWLLVFLVTVLSGGYYYIVINTCVAKIENCVYDGTDTPTAPAVYRVLQPALERLIAPNVTRADNEIMLVDLALQTVIIALTIPALYVWLKRWATPDYALFGVYLFGFVYLLSYHFTFSVLSTSLEVLFVVVALLLIERRWLWFVPLVALASTNRETAIFLVGIYAAYFGRAKWCEVLALCIVWTVVTVWLRLTLGMWPHMLGENAITATFVYNLENLSDGIFTNIILLPLGAAVVMSYRHAPAPLQRLAWVAAAWLVAMLAGSAWNEFTRLVLPLIPLLLPLVFTKESLRPSPTPA